MVKLGVISYEGLRVLSDYIEDIDVRQARIRVNDGEASIINGLKGGLLMQIIGGW